METKPLTERIAELERQAFQWLKLIDGANTATSRRYYAGQASKASREAKRLAALKDVEA